MKQIDWMKLIQKAGICLLIAFVLLFAFSCILAWMASEEILTPESAQSIANILRIAVILIVCFYVSKQSRQGRLITSLCTACVFVLVLMLCKAVLFPTETLDTGIVFWLSVLIAVPAGVAASQKKARKR